MLAVLAEPVKHAWLPGNWATACPSAAWSQTMSTAYRLLAHGQAGPMSQSGEAGIPQQMQSAALILF